MKTIQPKQEGTAPHPQPETCEPRSSGPGNSPTSPMGETKVRLPFGGCASTNSDEVRAPRLGPVCLLLFIVIIVFVVMGCWIR